MSTTAWIVLGLIILAIIVIATALVGLRRRRLQSRFGPEYQRVAGETGSKWRADSELAARQQRRQKLDIRPLAPEQRDRYGRAWQQVQADFVDQPYEAVANADKLVTQVMRDRGYPMENFEQHANDLSVDYPQLVDNYRGAHAVATRQRSANTEDLRKAMLHYRNLFQELLGQPGDGRRVGSQAAARDGETTARDGQASEGSAARDGELRQRQPVEPSPRAREGQR